MAEAAKKRPAAKKEKKLPVWIYEAKTRTGEVRKGEIEAPDAETVNARLRSIGVQPIKVKRKPLELSLSFGSSVKQADILLFTRTFATMIDAGLPLVQCLELLANQSENPAFKKILNQVRAKVEGGSTFADALREHPKVFDELYTQLVAAGEVGGILDTILNRLATYIEKNAKLIRRLKSAMIYPAIVLTVALGILIVLLLFVTPTFEKMFKDMGGQLPGPTQFVVNLSKAAQETWYWWLIGIVALVVAFKTFVGTNRGRRIWDAFLLKIPKIGDVIRKGAVARFTRTLGTMISSGVPILDALDVVAKTAGNRTVEAAIVYARGKISEGKTIVQPLLETKVFPEMVVQMIGVGEATGAMDQMLNKIADFYDDELDAAIAGLTSMIEPLMMVFLGGIVGGFMISMYMPIFEIAGAIK